MSVRRPAQLKVGPAVGTSFVALKSSHYPFDHLDVRRAVNFAVDRARLVELAGGPLAAEPSCQLTIPGYPAYQPYCPYSASADGTHWQGPDLATARRLVAGSGTAGAHVTVADLVGDINPPFDAYIADVLRGLGYNVELRVKPVSDVNERAFYDPASDIDAMSGGVAAPTTLDPPTSTIRSCAATPTSPIPSSTVTAPPTRRPTRPAPSRTRTRGARCARGRRCSMPWSTRRRWSLPSRTETSGTRGRGSATTSRVRSTARCSARSWVQ